jgi:hypothetical protein
VWIFSVAILFVAIFAIFTSQRTNAAPITDFTAGNIIDDSIFYNKNSGRST